MTDPSRLHQRPEAEPLADARRSLACARTALAAAVHLQPALGQPLGRIHAVLADAEQELQRLRSDP